MPVCLEGDSKARRWAALAVEVAAATLRRQETLVEAAAATCPGRHLREQLGAAGGPALAASLECIANTRRTT